MREKAKKELIKIAKGEITESFYDLDTILQKIFTLSNDNIKYDVMIHRFFEEEIGHIGFPDGWFCHIIFWEYDAKKDYYFKNIDKGIKVFGCKSAKAAVIEALKIMFEDEI